MARHQRRGESIASSSAYSFFALLAGAVFTAGLTFFLARRLGTSGFGVLALALGITGLVLLPLDFGISTAAARFIAEHRGDRARAAAVLADALRIKLPLSVLIAALLWVLAGPIAEAYAVAPLTWTIRGIAIAMVGQSIMMMTSAFAAIAQVRFQLWTSLTESAVEVTASIGLVLAGGGAAGAAFGRAIGYTAGGVMTLALLAYLFGARALPRSVRFGSDGRRIATYGSVVLIVDGTYTLFSQVDVLIIGAVLGAGAVGIFSGPLRLVAFLALPGGAISTAVSPQQARNRDREPNVPAFTNALRVLLIVQSAMTAFVVGWAPLIVYVALGPKYGQSSSVLQALAPFVFMVGFGSLVSVTANYLGEARRRVPIGIAAVAINTLLDLILVPKIGVVGGCVGTDAAYALYAPAHLLLCQRSLGFDLRGIAGTMLRTLAAGAATTGVLLALGNPLSATWRIPVGAVAGAVAFAAVLLLTGEVTRRDLSLVFRRPPFAQPRRDTNPRAQ